MKRILSQLGIVAAIAVAAFIYGGKDCRDRARAAQEALQERVDTAATRVAQDAQSISQLQTEIAKLRGDRLDALPDDNSCGLSYDRLRLIE